MPSWAACALWNALQVAADQLHNNQTTNAIWMALLFAEKSCQPFTQHK
jgi:hypothetical protein